MNQSQPEGQEALRDKVQDCERQLKDLKREIELTQNKLNFNKPVFSQFLKEEKEKAQKKKREDFEKLAQMIEGLKLKNREDVQIVSDFQNIQVSDLIVRKKVVVNKTYSSGNKRNSYPNEVKSFLVLLCAEYGIDEVHEATSIPYESLKTMRKIFKSSGGFKKRGRKVRYLAFDEHIKQWILDKRRFATKVTARRVFNYVRHEAEKQGYTDLKFGWGWFRRFLRRHKNENRRRKREKKC